MRWQASVVSCAIMLLGARSAIGDHELPDDFIVGAGTSSYQCEGAWNVSDKGKSTMDMALHSERLASLMTNGDVAADSYHRFKDDVAAASALKLQMYRFSLSWARLLPTGRTDNVSADGLRYYKELLDELEKNGIQPMITLLHFDFPYALWKEFGGWGSDKMVDAFVDYADFVFTHFGNRVRYWTTHNEPYLFCGMMLSLENGFSNGDPLLPLYENPAADYECLHRILLSHGKVYRLYQEKFARKQGGLIGLSNFSFAPRPNSTSYSDVAAARRHYLFTLGTSFAPLVTGEYPAEVRHIVEEASRLEGLNKSRLPEFTPQQSTMLRGSIDFLGVNLYFGQVVAAGSRPQQGSIMTDARVNILSNSIHAGDVKAYKEMTPYSLRDTVLWLWDEYRVPIFITENGLITDSDVPNPLDDKRRAAYHSSYMRELLRAVHEDGVPVLGYLAWSLIDLFEWLDQYKSSYGLVHVDFAGGTLKRTLKQSSSFFVELAATRRVPDVPARAPAASRALGGLLAGLLATLAATNHLR